MDWYFLFSVFFLFYFLLVDLYILLLFEFDF